jgi:soluble lytic murein transglycosylase-like protein
VNFDVVRGDRGDAGILTIVSTLLPTRPRRIILWPLSASVSGKQMRPALLTALALTLAQAVSPAAGDVAYLHNGASLEITAFRLEGEFVYLDIRGGGQVALPSSAVRQIRRTPAETPGAVPDRPAMSPVENHPPERSPEAAPSVATPSAVASEQLPAGAVFDPAELRKLAGRMARRHGLSEALVQAVVQVESRYDAFAVSPRGAMGLMQLMPQTARRFQVKDVFDPVANLDGGVRYLKELLELYDGETHLALAAYNAGEKAVERYGGIPPYRETMQYVDRVLHALRR